LGGFSSAEVPAQFRHNFQHARKKTESLLTLASNLDRLRAECGWSIEELADKAGVDASTVKRHIAGKGITPKTAAAYAEAFGKRLGRHISVSELKGQLPETYK
jgi:hypothetical protein